MTKTSSASDACYRLPPGFCSSAEAGARLLCASVALESQLAKQKDISSFRPQGKLLREQDMLSTSNIPEDDFQAYRWGLIRQLLHSSCLANTFFPAEILPNRLKGNFPFSSISRTTHSKKRSAIARLAKADLRHPLSPPPPLLPLVRFFISHCTSSPPSLWQRGLWIRPKSSAPEKLSLKDRERKLLFSYTP